MQRALLGDAFGLRGVKDFIQRGVGVGSAIVQHQAHFFCVRILLLNKCVENVCPLHRCPRLRDFGTPLTGAWGKGHKKVGRPMALRLCIIAQWLARRSGERSTACPDQRG